MIDLHSHILFGIDDGSESLEESIKILETAKNNGVTDIVLTPHYIYNSEYNSKILIDLIRSIINDKII